MNRYVICIEYIEIDPMDWSDEQKQCFADHYRHYIILWDTLYINYRNKLKIDMCSFILLVDEYNARI
jgi:hypothetical protein